ncbi:hypothetical protein BC835DRAFT_1283921, partial [Cytidiella melzeri]
GPLGTESSERCFTYCSQSLSGRMHKQEPWCRTVCLRRVFKTEISGTLLTSGQEIEMKFPLPPEGQKGAHLVQSLLGAKHSGKGTGDDGGAEPDWKALASATGLKDVQVWQPGWYLYMSKRLAPSVNELSSMQHSIWEDHKFRVNYEHYLKNHSHKSMKELADEFPGMMPGMAKDVARMVEIEGTILVPLPPPMPSLNESLSQLLTPTSKMLKLTADSITSGRQAELAGRLWEKAQTKDPFILASNVLQKAWKTLRNVDDDDDGSGRNRP